MLKEMYVLKGKGNAGKSTSIKMTLEKFLTWAVRNDSPTQVTYLYLTNREVAATVRFGKEVIGIATRGDSAKEVQKGLDFFLQQNCTVVLCPTREKGKSLEAARCFAKNQMGRNPDELAKQKAGSANLVDLENSNSARKMFSWLKKSI